HTRSDRDWSSDVCSSDLAVVVFGLGSASPVALGTSDDRPTTVVRVPPHDPAVPGPVRRRPQALPGPGRRRGARDQGVSVRPGWRSEERRVGKGGGGGGGA